MFFPKNSYALFYKKVEVVNKVIVDEINLFDIVLLVRFFSLYL